MRQRQEIQELLRTHGVVRVWSALVLLASVSVVFGAAAEVTPSGDDQARIAALTRQLTALSPSVRSSDACRSAETAVITSRALAGEYRVLGPPLFHNFLVNIGARKRGLCFEWTQDVMSRLAALRLETLQLHWGDARATTLREHNCVVMTAKGQAFERGIVLDAWRHSGRLFFAPVREDHYPWLEAESRCVPRHIAPRPHPL